MTNKERQARAQCPFVELIGGIGYVCNRRKGIGHRHFRNTDIGNEKCYGCKDMFKLTNK